MTIELRVLSGARTGFRETFAGDAVTVGRHPDNDLALHPDLDRDVSARHAEVRRATDGTWLLADRGSTNGTYLNGTRIAAPERLRDGDVIGLGGAGPKLEVRLAPADAAGQVHSPYAATMTTPPGGSPPGDGAPRRPTTERVAIAVEAQMSRLRRRAMAALAVVAAGLLGAYWVGARTSAGELSEMRRMLAGYDSTTQLLRAQLQGAADTAALARLERTNDSLRTAAARASQGSSQQRAEIRAQVSRWREGATAMSQVDLPAINDRNAPAVAFLVSELEGRPLGGTAFAVTPQGLMVTNRHLVRSAGGATATRIVVKFRDEAAWRAARVVRVAAGEDDDLALLQLEDAAQVPAVLGLASDGASLREGAPVVTIGYPLGRATRMDGADGEGFVAKTSLYPGTVSKTMPTLLQIAAFAGHGSSGSPVFDASGRVAGVVWGGPRESNGQLVYAVPAARVAELIAGG